jgi:hypothetical protein
MEREGSLPLVQDFVTGQYPEPAVSSPHLHIHFLQDHFDGRPIHPDTTRFPNWSVFVSAFPTEMMYLFPHASYLSPLCKF